MIQSSSLTRRIPVDSMGIGLMNWWYEPLSVLRPVVFKCTRGERMIRVRMHRPTLGSAKLIHWFAHFFFIYTRILTPRIDYAHQSINHSIIRAAVKSYPSKMTKWLAKRFSWLFGGRCWTTAGGGANEKPKTKTEEKPLAAGCWLLSANSCA